VGEAMNPRRHKRKDKSKRHHHACWLCRGILRGNTRSRIPVRDLRRAEV